ncbi:MAG: glycosyltransferase family 4 protein [Candidatus Bathyarchaeota archaeon]|nr:glycosyltransferase family 4 protein [Candidatus Bathyarchaeota archaeon]
MKIFFQDVGDLEEYTFGLTHNILSDSCFSITIGASTARNFIGALQFKSYLKKKNNRFHVKLMNPPLITLAKKGTAKFFSSQYRRFFSSYDVLHINELGRAYLKAAFKTDVPKILTYHDHMLAQETDKQTLDTLNSTISKMRFVVTPNQFMYNVFKEKLNYEPLIIPHGINTNLFNDSISRSVARKHLGISQSRKVIFWNARLDQEKNLETLINAMPKVVQEVPEALFLIHGRSGKSSYKKYVLQYAKRKIEDAQISTNVILSLRRLPHEQIPYFYRSADVFVHTSYLEAFGLVLAEAMACKVPVIATRSMYSTDVLGNFGVFFNQGDSQDLAEKITDLLTSEKKQNSLREAAFKRVLSNFTFEKAAEKYLHLYDKMHVVS